MSKDPSYEALLTKCEDTETALTETLELLLNILAADETECLMLKSTWTTCSPNQYWPKCAVCLASDYIKTEEK